MNYEILQDTSPKEELLIKLIESKTLNILIDDSFTEDLIQVLFRAVQLYSKKVDRNAHIGIHGLDGKEEAITKLAKHYHYDKIIDYISRTDHPKLLSYFLGCDVFISNDHDSFGIGFAGEVFLPRICMNTEYDGRLIEGVFYVGMDESSLASILTIIKKKTYRDQLSGHTALIRLGDTK